MGTPLFLDERVTRLSEAVSLPAGIALLAAHSFPTGRVTALGIEHAIEHVEEAIMAAGPLPGAGGELDLRDPAVAALFANVAPGATHLPRDVVERAFGELADHAMGSAVAARGMPTDAASAARLVWLRELMHHGPFRALNLRR
jgi:hypothetical protein